jgi:hypothetical protein
LKRRKYAKIEKDERGNLLHRVEYVMYSGRGRFEDLYITGRIGKYTK